MNWFKLNYLPDPRDWTKWDASPAFAPKELLKKVPKAWIAVAELDILREEGVQYGEKLKELGPYIFEANSRVLTDNSQHTIFL